MTTLSPSPDPPVHPPLTLQPPPSQQSLALECSICVEQYSQFFDHNPRSLRCGHTFCTKCLFRIMTTRGIKCPVCSKWHNLERPDVTQLPPNYAVMEIVKDYVEPVENQEARQPKCDACHEKPALVVCLDCSPGSQFVFCESCDSSEHNRPFAPVRRHRRFPIDNPPPAHIICTVHRNNRATLYSVSLSQFACDECKLSQDWVSRGPQFEPLHEAVRRLRTQTQKLNQYSRDVIDRLTGSNRSLSTIVHELGPSASTAKSQIQKTFGEVMDIIQERQQNLLKYVEDECAHRQQNLEDQLQKVQQATRQFVDAHEDLNTLLPKSDVEFLLKYQVVVERMENLLRDDDKSLYRPIAHQDIPFYVPKDILHELRVLGAVGGGPTPTEIECKHSGEWGTLMRLDWQLPPKCGDVLHYQVEYEYLPNKQNVGWRGSGVVDTSYHDTEPHCVEIPGNVLKAYISYLCPGYTYRFRIRSSNAAGLGMWSNQVISTCEDFPFNLGYTKKIHRIRIPHNGYYRITASGAKAKDGQRCFGGCGAVISATFSLKAGEVLIILCGGMSELQYCNTGGGGGTFVAVNEINKDSLLVAAGGGGGTRGFDDRDENGCDASLEPSGTDGRGHEHGKGGVDGGPGEDANSSNFIGPCWGYGGAGFLQNASSARSFLSGGDAGQYGGFGGGGAVGVYGGGGGGGYSGGGGGRGGGGGGSYVREDGVDIEKKIGSEGHGSVLIEKVAPPYPSDEPASDSPPNRVISPPITAVVRVDSNVQQQIFHPTQLEGQTSQSSVVSESNGSRHSSLSGTTGVFTGSTGISSSSELEPVSEVVGLELDDNLESTNDLSQHFVVSEISASGDRFHAAESEFPPSTTHGGAAVQPPEPPIPATMASLMPATSQQPSLAPGKSLYSHALRGNANTNAQPESAGAQIKIPTTMPATTQPSFTPHFTAQPSTASSSSNVNPQMLSKHPDSQFQSTIPTMMPATTQPSFTGAPPHYAAQPSTASSSSNLNPQMLSKPPDSQFQSAMPTTMPATTQPSFTGGPPHFTAQPSTASSSSNLNPQMLSKLPDSQFQSAIPTTMPAATQPSFTGAHPHYAAQLSTTSSSSKLNPQMLSKPPDSQFQSAIPTTMPATTQPSFTGGPPHFAAQPSTASSSSNLNPQMSNPPDSQFQSAMPTTMPATTQPSFTGAPPHYAAQLSTASSSSDVNSQVVSKPPDSQS